MRLLHIKEQSLGINLQTDTDRLDDFYIYLFKSISQKRYLNVFTLEIATYIIFPLTFVLKKPYFNIGYTLI